MLFRSQAKLNQIVPSYGTRLNDNPEQVLQEWAYTSEVLQLTPPPGVDTQAPQATPATDPMGQEHVDTDAELAP